MASNSRDISTPKTRRSNKPLMEKRRRERINRSLNSLKELVLLAEQKDISKFNKLEKADILEMTVRHVKALHDKSELTPRSGEPTVKYQSGFERCLLEVEKFLYTLPNFSPDLISRVISHLKKVSSALPKGVVGKLGPRGRDSKVKAAIDTSILKADVLRHEGVDGSAPPALTAAPGPHHPRLQEGLNSCGSVESGNVLFVKSSHPLEPNPHSVKLELLIPPTCWGASVPSHPFPPSPPDSSRCSSSPDSLRGSPRSGIDTTTSLQGLEKQISSHSYLPKMIKSEKDQGTSPPVPFSSCPALSSSYLPSSSSLIPPSSAYISTSPFPYVPMNGRCGGSTTTSCFSVASPSTATITSSSPSSACLSSTVDTKPLNLTMPHTSRQVESHGTTPSPSPHLRTPSGDRSTNPSHSQRSNTTTSPSRVLTVKQESEVSPSLPPAPPSSGGSSSSDVANALALEARERCAPSLRTLLRPTPYPKKDAALRYQKQTSSSPPSPHPSAQEHGKDSASTASDPPILPSAASAPIHDVHLAAANHWRPW